MVFFASHPTPQPSHTWVGLSSDERLSLVSSLTEQSDFQALVRPVSALPSGFVYVELIAPLPAAERGVRLRDYEFLLKESIDDGLTVWCEPVGDKSALRKLRGIEVKAL